MSARRFEAGVETVLRDLASTAVKMRDSSGWAIVVGGTVTKAFTTKGRQSGIVVEGNVLELFPLGAGVRFVRKGVAYRFSCLKYPLWLDNLRASQLAVTLLYRIYQDYAVTQGQEAEDAFGRLFGGHTLELGDGRRSWWQVLNVPREISLLGAEKAYLRQVRLLHPDNQETGDEAAAMALNKAMDEARAEKGA